MSSKTALRRAIKVAGGQSSLARKIGGKTGRNLRQGNIWAWLNRTKQVPPEIAVHIEIITNECGEIVTRKELCPNFPWEPVAGDKSGSTRRQSA